MRNGVRKSRDSLAPKFVQSQSGRLVALLDRLQQAKNWLQSLERYVTIQSANVPFNLLAKFDGRGKGQNGSQKVEARFVVGRCLLIGDRQLITHRRNFIKKFDARVAVLAEEEVEKSQ